MIETNEQVEEVDSGEEVASQSDHNANVCQRFQARRVLEGRMDNLPPVSSKTVRVFISSTFSGK